ncbi:hypothetical protein TAMA11512_21420 [Selenomonas sp. TAMA-11512]|uniref:hypothetical protein n=1 Tax=Selenomonas sp. TAMA-11512 TaxID=3095337 RepID=UPI003087F705|nr:hypothetical protein TAMA11512_21420 [Selenomonas sp. TAMA-11512]
MDNDNNNPNGGLLSGGTDPQGAEGNPEGVLSGGGEGGNEAPKDLPENDDDRDGDGKEGEGDKPKSEPKAPEAYEAFNTPEGFTVDETAFTEFSALAKDLDLSQESAQRLVDYQVKFMQEQQAKLDAYAANEVKTWKEETGKAFTKEEIADAVKGFKSAPQEVQNMLAACGFDNNKSFVEFFMHVGRSIKEDKFETGKPSGGEKKTAANVLYPELN